MLPLLPRLSLLRERQARRQAVEPAVRIIELLVDEADAGHKRGDVRTDCFGGSIGDRDRLRAQHAEHVGGVEAANAMALDDFGNARLARASCFVRRRHELPQIEEPLGAEIVLEFEHGRKVAPQLLAHAIGEAGALGHQVLGNARPFPELDDNGIGDGQQAEAARVGAQGRGQHLGIATVVLAARRREAVAEAVELLGVDGVDVEAALEQRLDDGPVRHLDGDVDLAGVDGPARRQQPVRHLGQSFAAVPEELLGNVPPIAIGDADMVVLTRPIDAGVPLSLIGHVGSPFETASHRDPRRSLYWRSECGSHFRRGLPTGHRSRPIHRGTCPPLVIGSQRTIGCSRRIGSVREFTLHRAVARQGTLRCATLHFARPATYTPRTARERYRRTERHGLSSPNATVDRDADRRAKSDGVPGGGAWRRSRQTPPPDAPNESAPQGLHVDRPAQFGGANSWRVFLPPLGGGGGRGAGATLRILRRALLATVLLCCLGVGAVAIIWQRLEPLSLARAEALSVTVLDRNDRLLRAYTTA